MSRTTINVGAVIEASNQINSAKSSVNSAKNSFVQAKNSIDGKIQNRSNIRNRLSTVQRQLSNIDAQIGNVRYVVQSGANLYRSTDERVASRRDDIRNNVGMRTGGQIPGKWASYFDDDRLKLHRNIVSISRPNGTDNGKHIELTAEKVLDIAVEMLNKVTEFLKKAEPYIRLFYGPTRDDSPVTDEFVRRAKNGEYANLCQLWYDALGEKEKNPETAFVELIEQRLPEGHPLTKATSEQIVAINYAGLDAVVVGDGNTAIVIFAGTDASSIDDLLADGAILVGAQSLQEELAVILVDALSKRYSDIVVTGHSLGGYLATAVTLKNDSVSKCIAFDPPGRYDAWFQEIFNSEQADKITTYEAKGSIISEVGFGVGDVIDLRVEENGSFLGHNHGIKEISDAVSTEGRGSSRRF